MLKSKRRSWRTDSWKIFVSAVLSPIVAASKNNLEERGDRQYIWDPMQAQSLQQLLLSKSQNSSIPGALGKRCYSQHPGGRSPPAPLQHS